MTNTEVPAFTSEMKDPEVPTLPSEERLDLADWMMERMSGLGDATDPLIPLAIRYAAEKTGLPKERVQQVVSLFGEDPNEATRWIEYYLNQVRNIAEGPE